MAAGTLNHHQGSLDIFKQKSEPGSTGFTLRLIPRSLASFDGKPTFYPTGINADILTPALYSHRARSFFPAFAVAGADPHWESASIQLTVRPARNWMMRFSHGWLTKPEELFPGVNIERTTFSTQHRVKTKSTESSSIFRWERINSNPGEIFGTFLIQSRFTVGKVHTIFGRIEQTPPNRLLLGTHRAADPAFTGNQIKLGYYYEFPKIGRTKYRVGTAVALNGALPEYRSLKTERHYSIVTSLNIQFN